MEEIEAPTEQLQEELQHNASHGGETWISWVAMSAAVLAVFAAVSALMSNHHSDEAMIEQIQASDQWALYQAKGVKSAVLNSKLELLAAFNRPAAPADKEKLVKYREEQEHISEIAKEKEHTSARHLSLHVIFARGVTMFQIAIAIAAIAAVVRRKLFWYIGLAFGIVGICFLAQGFLPY